MAVATAPFLDTSVFVSGLLEMGDASPASRTLLDAVATGSLHGVRTAWHCCLEFYAVATRLPGGLRVSPELASRMVVENILRRITVVDLPANARIGFLQTVVEERISGGRVYDAHIAEVARLAGARIVVTGNRRDFTGLMRHGIRVVTPEEFVEEHRL